MIRALYKLVLGLPSFRGRHRLDGALRGLLQPPVDMVDGLKMELDPLEWTQIEFLSGKLPETQTLALIRNLLNPGDVCIDIGAHVGLHALVAAQAVGPTGQVLALDPQPYNCDRLLNNAALNGFNHILVLVAAAGDQDGFVVLHNQKRNDKTRLTLAGAGVSDAATRFETPVMKLDTLAARHNIHAVDLIKIDVEGYEREVLRGGAGVLAVTRNVIFESLPETGKSMVQETAGVLIGLGFTLRQVDGSPWEPGQTSIDNNVWAARD